jgi:RNase P subunit RPR2
MRPCTSMPKAQNVSRSGSHRSQPQPLTAESRGADIVKHVPVVARRTTIMLQTAHVAEGCKPCSLQLLPGIGAQAVARRGVRDLHLQRQCCAAAPAAAAAITADQ